MEGLDDIGLSMEKIDNVAKFEKGMEADRPWV